MEKSNPLTGLKKRQQIRLANKTVFAWIIAASVVTGICGVGVQFLLQQLFFNNKIYAEVAKTNSTLESNIKAYDGLKRKVVELVADSNLTVLKKGENSTALQVIIDALPTEENRAALATSLQTEVLGPSGVTINSFSAVDSLAAGTAVGGTIPSFTFNFTITGSYEQVAQAIKNMERSIRPLSIQSLELQGTDRQLKASLIVVTYYQPPASINLKEIKVKP